jgi:hypothetical protein
MKIKALFSMALVLDGYYSYTTVRRIPSSLSSQHTPPQVEKLVWFWGFT